MLGWLGAGSSIAEQYQRYLVSNDDVTSNDSPTQQLENTLVINMLLFAIMCVCFEFLRRKKSIYLNRFVRRFIESNRVPDKPASYPFAWIGKLSKVSDQQILDMIGLDGYICIRYIVVCLRTACFCSFWGLLVLVPIYSATDRRENSLNGWDRFTIANIPEDPTAIRLWAPVVFCYMFAGFFCQLMYLEYKNFIGKRVQYLVRGDADTPVQTYYTVLVERLPSALRSGPMLAGFFEHLYPGEFYSAEVALDLKDLEMWTAKRKAVRNVLEKYIALCWATKERPTVWKKPHSMPSQADGGPFSPVQPVMENPIATYWGLEVVDAIEYYSKYLTYLNIKVEALQKEYFEQRQRLDEMEEYRLLQIKSQLEEVTAATHGKLRHVGSRFVGLMKDINTEAVIDALTGGTTTTTTTAAGGGGGGGGVTPRNIRESMGGLARGSSGSSGGGGGGGGEADDETLSNLVDRSRMRKSFLGPIMGLGADEEDQEMTNANGSSSSSSSSSSNINSGGGGGGVSSNPYPPSGQYQHQDQQQQLLRQRRGSGIPSSTSHTNTSNSSNIHGSSNNGDSLSRATAGTAFLSPATATTGVMSTPGNNNNNNSATQQTAVGRTPKSRTMKIMTPAAAGRVSLSAEDNAELTPPPMQYLPPVAGGGGGGGGGRAGSYQTPTVTAASAGKAATAGSAGTHTRTPTGTASVTYYKDIIGGSTLKANNNNNNNYQTPNVSTSSNNNNNNNNNNNGHHWETSTQVQEGKTGDAEGAEGAEEDVLIEVDAPRTSSATKLFNQGADAVHSVAKQGVQGIAKEGARTAEYAAKGALRGVLEATRALELLTFGAYYRVSSTAFVTFKSRQAKCSSHQMLLSHEYYGIKVTPAPNPRDIVWENVSIPESQISIRTSIADGVLIVGALFWSLVVTFISAISNMQQISQVIPVLQNYSNTVIYQFLNNYLAIGLLLVLLAVLPYLFDFIARSYEGLKTESEIQNSIMTRYFYYQLANVYVSLGLGSVATSLHEILSNPSNILSILGTSVPSFSIYFANLMIIKTLTAVPVEMLRVFPLLEVLSVTTCMDKKKCTRRELRTGCFADPPMLYGWIYPNLMMVLMIMLTYCCIAPFLMPLCALFFALAYLMYKYQLLYVYINEEQSGGFMWYAVFNRSMVVLLAGVCTLLCYLAIRMTFISGPFYLLLPLPFLIVLFWHHCDKRIKAPAMTLSLEGALELDRGTKDSEARGESTPHDQFTNTCYRQPALAEGKLRPALYRQNKPVLPEVERGPAPYDLMMHSFSGRTYDLASGRGGAADPYTNQRNSNSSRRVRGTSVASITELSDADEDGDGDEDPESDRGPRGGGAGGGRKVFASSLDVFEDPSGASASQDSDGGGGRGSGGGGMGAAAAGSWVGDVRSTLVPLQVTPARSSAGAGAGAGAGGSAGGGGVLTPLSESATPLAAAASSRTPTGRTATVPPAVATHRGLPPTHPPSSRSPTHGGRGASSGGGGGSSMQNHFGIEDVTSVSVSMEDEEEEEEDGDVSTVAELENDEMVDSEDDAPDMEHAIHELLEDESSKHHHPQQQPIPFPANTPTGAGAGARRSQSMSYAASSSTTTTVSPLADHRGDLESAGQQQGGGVVQYLRHPTVADINRGGYAINSQTKPEDQQRGEHSVNNSSVSGGSPPGNYYNFNYGATGHTPPPPPAATTGSTGAAGVTVTAEDDATASASASASHPHISSRRSRHRTSVAALALSSLTAGGGGDDDSNDDDDEVSRAVVGGRNIRNKQL